MNEHMNVVDQFEKWRKVGEYRVNIGQEEKRMANMLQNGFNTLPTLPNQIFNKPKRSLPMWINKEELERMIDERVSSALIRAGISQDGYEERADMILAYTYNYKIKDVIKCILNKLNVNIMRITNNEQVILVDKPKESKAKKVKKK